MNKDLCDDPIWLKILLSIALVGIFKFSDLFDLWFSKYIKNENQEQKGSGKNPRIISVMIKMKIFVTPIENEAKH